MIFRQAPIMLDKEKTKTQLIRELGVLRRQISRIEPLKAGQQQAKEALRDSEQKYRSLIANIPDVVWTTDAKGSTTFISPNVEKVYGFSPREIYEQGALNSILSTGSGERTASGFGFRIDLSAHTKRVVPSMLTVCFLTSPTANGLRRLYERARNLPGRV